MDEATTPPMAEPTAQPAPPAKPLTAAQKMAALIVAMENMATEAKTVISADGPAVIAVLAELQALGASLPPSLAGVTTPMMQDAVAMTNFIKGLIAFV